MRSCAPTAYPRSGQRLKEDGLAYPTACASRFSQPPDAFIRPEPGGLVSCHIRSWGCALQSFLLPCSRTPSPAPLPSCRLDAPADRPTRETTVATEATSTKTRAYGTAPGAPPPSGVCSARESATSAPAVTPAPSAWLSWAFRPPGFSPPLERPGLHRASPHGLWSAGRERPADWPLRVSVPVGLARLSRDRRPSWALAPRDHHER
jgi:hypothetical protein